MAIDGKTLRRSFDQAKWSDQKVSKNLFYYSERLKPAASIQIVANLKKPLRKGNLFILDPQDFFRNLEVKMRI